MIHYRSIVWTGKRHRSVSIYDSSIGVILKLLNIIIRRTLPDSPISPEIGDVLTANYLINPDLWHEATAFWFVSEFRGLAFTTLSVRQQGVSEALGPVV